MVAAVALATPGFTYSHHPAGQTRIQKRKTAKWCDFCKCPGHSHRTSEYIQSLRDDTRALEKWILERGILQRTASNQRYDFRERSPKQTRTASSRSKITQTTQVEKEKASTTIRGAGK